MLEHNIEEWKNQKSDDKIYTDSFNNKDTKLLKNFNSELSFKNSKVEGVSGFGPSKINEFTISALAESFCIYLKNKKVKGRGVLISHDNTPNFSLFASAISKVFIQNGIKPFVFQEDKYCSSPLSSFAIKDLGLKGGIIIAASDVKNKNIIKFLGEEGIELDFEDSNFISETYKLLNPLKIERKEGKVWSVPISTTKKYISEIKGCTIGTEIQDISVAFSSQNGSTGKTMKSILESLKVQNVSTQIGDILEGNRKFNKYTDPAVSKSFKKVSLIARKNKTDLIVSNNPSGRKLGFGVRYKKRYKFLNGNQMMALYLNYIIEVNKANDNFDPTNKFIITTELSGGLLKQIAFENNIKILESKSNLSDVGSIVSENKRDELLFASDGSLGYIIGANPPFTKDSLRASIIFMEMASYYKLKNTNLFDVLEMIQLKYGRFRNTNFIKKTSVKQASVIFKKAGKLNKARLAGKKIISVKKESGDFGKSIKVNFEDGSWFYLVSGDQSDIVKIFVESTGTTSQRLIDIVTFEKEISNWFDDNTEEFEDKKFSYKSFVKYITFISIIIIIFLLVFKFIYTGAGSNGGTFIIAKGIFNRGNSGIWLSIWLWILFTNFLNAWSVKRMFAIQGIKVKTTHLLISQIMGGVISFITPFAIGGDAIGYWYLRRKKIPRGPLIAALTSSTLISEFKFTIQTALLVGIGWGVYTDIFNQNDPQAKAALMLFAVGLVWSIFSTGMIFMLVLWKRFQEFILRISIQFLEWTRFVVLTDPSAKEAQIQFEFASMRKGMKTIWTKWWFPFELLFYRMLPLFFDPSMLYYMQLGLINKKAAAGPYLSQIVAADIRWTANSMSLTPGGSGTGEWLFVNINKYIYTAPKSFVVQSPKAIASGMDFLSKIIFSWPWLSFSAFLILSVVLENNKHNKRRKFKIRVFNVCLWTLLITGYLIYFFLIMI